MNVTALQQRRALSSDQMLAAAATFFAIAVLIHNSDHVRRGADSVHLDVFWIGSAAITLEVSLVVLSIMRHRVAPLAAATGGLFLAVGYVVAHFLPSHPFLSDSFVSASNVSPLSWFAASLEVVAALTLGVTGLVLLHDRGGLASAGRPNAAQGRLGDVLTHPVVAAVIAGNAVILAASLAQLFGIVPSAG
jgi:hypothetical protein